ITSFEANKFNFQLNIKEAIIKADNSATWLGNVSIGLAIALLRVLCQPGQDESLNMLTALGQFAEPVVNQNDQFQVRSPSSLGKILEEKSLSGCKSYCSRSRACAIVAIILLITALITCIIVFEQFKSDLGANFYIIGLTVMGFFITCGLLCACHNDGRNLM
ncbi:unnamed protein product, partial [Meganyctiphanes norvegica]